MVGTSPLSPSELLVALHMIEPSKKANPNESKGDIRSVMKGMKTIKYIFINYEVFLFLLTSIFAPFFFHVCFVLFFNTSFSFSFRLLSFVFSMQ